MTLGVPRMHWSSADLDSYDDAATNVVDKRSEPPPRGQQSSWAGDLYARLTRDLALAAPRLDASAPVQIAPPVQPNVFESDPLPSDPPPPWHSAPTVKVGPRSRGRSPAGWFLFLVVAVAGATTMLLSLDAGLRDHTVRTARSVLAHHL